MSVHATEGGIGGGVDGEGKRGGGWIVWVDAIAVITTVNLS